MINNMKKPMIQFFQITGLVLII